MRTRALLPLVLLALAAAPARADVVDDAFARGNALAAAGDYEAAARAYEEAEALLPGRSAALSFNLGTAYAQLGDLGAATYHLRRALQPQAGASADVAEAARRNLGVVRQRAEVAAAAGGLQIDRPETWRDAAHSALRAPAFGWLSLGAGWLALVLWITRGRFRSAARSALTGLAAVLAALYFVFGGLHGYALRAELGASPAIALPARLEVREGPGVHRKVVFTVQGGSRLGLVERGAGWGRVRLPGGLEGWAPLTGIGELAAPPRRLREAPASGSAAASPAPP
jgi:tetratricopeptide (TPR) repeat protein